VGLPRRLEKSIAASWAVVSVSLQDAWTCTHSTISPRGAWHPPPQGDEGPGWHDRAHLHHLRRCRLLLRCLLLLGRAPPQSEASRRRRTHRPCAAHPARPHASVCLPTVVVQMIDVLSGALEPRQRPAWDVPDSGTALLPPATLLNSPRGSEDAACVRWSSPPAPAGRNLPHCGYLPLTRQSPPMRPYLRSPQWCSPRPS
jgi:hypothetical protein